MFSAASACLFVCLCALYKNLGRVRTWGYSPAWCAPHKCGVGLRRWENQGRLSSVIHMNNIGPLHAYNCGSLKHADKLL